MFSYTHVTNRSTLFDQHIYNEQNEGVDGVGQPMYSAEVMLESPLGPHMNSMRFYTDGLGLRHGTVMEQMADHEQSIEVWDLSLGIQYSIVKLPKFELLLGGGGGISAVSGMRNHMRSEVYHAGELVTIMSGDYREQDKLNKTFGSVYGSAQARYRVSGNVQVTAGFRYSRSISSLRNAGEGQPRTYLTRLVPSVGVTYEFNKDKKK